MIVQIGSKQRIPVTVRLKNESNIRKRFGSRKFGTFGAKVMPQPMEKYLLLYKREKKILNCMVLDSFKTVILYFVKIKLSWDLSSGRRNCSRAKIYTHKVRMLATIAGSIVYRILQLNVNEQ